MTQQLFTSNLVAHTFRLNPGQDLKRELLKYAQNQGLRASAIVSSVGSLETCLLRMASAAQNKSFPGPLEIVSLTGTLSSEGVHMHISVSDDEGRVWGGHLLDGCTIHTTAEIVLVELVELEFKREMDATTGYKELQIFSRK
jgi:Predicted DNA-binding protein with PD1-like DNA-binding motif